MKHLIAILMGLSGFGGWASDAQACTSGAQQSCTLPDCGTAHQECVDDSPPYWGPCTCDNPPPPPPDLVQPSELFCGNVRLYQDDARYPWQGTPTNNPAIENDGGIAICLAANGVEVRYRAVRNFEIGGWVLSSSGSPCADYNVRNS